MPRDTAGAILAPTYPMLRDATLRTFLELTKRAGILKAFNKAEMTAELVGNRTVLFRSADKPDRLRGPNLGWFWIDEAAMCDPSVWLIMMGRRRRAPGLAWVTTTPRGKNWVHRVFVEQATPHHACIRASSLTNQYLPRDFVQSLVDAYDEQFAMQEIGGEFLDDVFGRLVPDWHIDRIPSLARPNRPGGLRWMTADLGEGGGRDSTVILAGDDLGILWGEESPWVGPAQAAAILAKQSRVWGVPHDRIVYDAGGGRGLDIEPYLEQHGITDAVAYKGSRSGGKQFETRRSRMGWLLRQRLDPERPKPPPPLRYDPDWQPSVFEPPPVARAELQPPFTIPPGWPLWPLLAQELRALKWHHKGKLIALEPKEQLMKTLGRSPNVVDALKMRFILGDDE